MSFLGPAAIDPKAVEADAEIVFEMINAYYQNSKPQVLGRRVYKVLLDIREDFPFECDLASANPFKKAAAFTCDFVLKRPIVTPFDAATTSPEILAIDNHQNAIIGLELSILLLHGAKLNNHTENGEVLIKNRIEMSTHYLTDLIAHIADPLSARNPFSLALIYESLVYQTNDYLRYRS